MTAPHRTRSFKSGNSVAVRLPKALGIGPNETFEITRHGDTVTARRIPTAAKEAERLGRFRGMLDELAKLPKPPRVQKRERIEFPERWS